MKILKLSFLLMLVLSVIAFFIFSESDLGKCNMARAVISKVDLGWIDSDGHNTIFPDKSAPKNKDTVNLSCRIISRTCPNGGRGISQIEEVCDGSEAWQ